MSVFSNGEILCNKTAVARLHLPGLRLKHGYIASIKTTHATKILQIVFPKFVTCICHGTIMEGISTQF